MEDTCFAIRIPSDVVGRVADADIASDGLAMVVVYATVSGGFWAAFMQVGFGGPRSRAVRFASREQAQASLPPEAVRACSKAGWMPQSIGRG